MKRFLIAFFSLQAFSASTIIYEADPSLLISYVTVVVQTGAKDDSKAKAGLTNMMGELLLRGTKKRTRDKFQSELERMGASLDVSTSNDLVAINGRVIAENTIPFLKLLQDALLSPSFAPKELESLRTEVLAEIAHIKNSNNRLPGLLLRRELFAGTSMEKPVAGSLSTVKGIKREDILQAYNNRFHQKNLVFAVASPVKEETVRKEIDVIFEKLPDGARKKEVSIAPKVPAKPTLIVIHKPQTSTGVLMFAQKGITIKDDARYTLNTGNFSFGGEPLVSRLFRTIRGELGWTYAIWSTYAALGGLSRQEGIYVINSTPSVEFTTKTIFKTLDMWSEYLDKGLKSDEMKLAHDSIINSYPFEFESAPKRLSQKLNSYLYDEPILSTDEYAKKISGIDNGDIKGMAKQRHTKDGWLIALVADETVFRKQLEEAQKDIPEDKRIKIAKVVTPDELVN